MTTDICIGDRWEPLQQQQQHDFAAIEEYDGGNSSSRLFERSRIKALSGEQFFLIINFEDLK